MTFKQTIKYGCVVLATWLVTIAVYVGAGDKALPQHAKSCTCIAASDKGDTVCSHRGSWGRGR